MLKAVIFDLDDTLYDYKTCDTKATNALLCYLKDKLDIPPEQGKLCLQQAKKIVKEQLGNVAASHNRILYTQILSELCGLKPAQYAYEMYEIYWNAMLEKMKPYPYVKKLWSILKENQIKIAILTDLTAQIQHRKLIKMGLQNNVDCLVTSEEAGAEKPDKVMFQKIMKKLGCQKDEVILIGDSLEKDILGAKAFGIPSIWFSENANVDQKQFNGEMLLSHIAAILHTGC